ncbi:MAG: hypothetical protein ACJAZV_001148 [Roseivirga sp.]|jgi:hypothetical protein
MKKIGSVSEEQLCNGKKIWEIRRPPDEECSLGK